MKTRVLIGAFFIFFSSILCGMCHASTGGPEDITILGEDKVNRKIYYIYSWHDQSERPSKLYCYNIKTRTLVTVGPTPEGDPLTRSAVYDRFIKAHDKYIDKVKAKVTTLKNDENIRVSYLISIIGDYYPGTFGSYKVKYWRDKIGVFVDGVITGTAFIDCYYNNKVVVMGKYMTSDGSVNIVHLRYTGRSDEGGYLKDALIISPTASDVAEDLEADANSEWFDIEELNK